MCVHRQKIKVYFKYWFCLHCTFVHISVNKKSLLIKHFSGVERWSYIEMLWEGSEFDLKSWFSMAILNTTIHNKLRLYITENQNMVYVVFGVFFYFSWLFLDASSVASLKMCGSSKCLSFSWITKERCLRSTPCGISVWHCLLE